MMVILQSRLPAGEFSSLDSALQLSCSSKTRQLNASRARACFCVGSKSQHRVLQRGRPYDAHLMNSVVPKRDAGHAVVPLAFCTRRPSPRPAPAIRVPGSRRPAVLRDEDVYQVRNVVMVQSSSCKLCGLQCTTQHCSESLVDLRFVHGIVYIVQPFSILEVRRGAVLGLQSTECSIGIGLPPHDTTS